MSGLVIFQLPSNIDSTDSENTVQLDVALEMAMSELSTNENLTKELPEGHKIKFEFNGKVVEPRHTLKSIGYFEIREPKPINVIYTPIPDVQAGKVHAYFFVYNDKRKQVVVSKNVEFINLLKYIKNIFGIQGNDQITLGTRSLSIQDMNQLFNVISATDIQVNSLIKGGRRRSHRSSSAAKKRVSAHRGRGSAAKKRTTHRNRRNRNRYSRSH